MAHGLSQQFTATFTSGGSLSSDVALGRSFARIFINIAGATNSCHFQGAPSVADAPGTYAQLKYPVLSGMSAPQTITVGTATSGSWVEVPIGGHPYIKVANVGGAADGAILKIIGSDL